MSRRRKVIRNMKNLGMSPEEAKLVNPSQLTIGRPVVLCGMPRRNEEAHFNATLGLLGATSSGRIGFIHASAKSTILPHTCNLLLARAYKGWKLGRTCHYFAMIHDDVCPQSGWLDILLDEMLRVNADMISAVIPIKNKSGLTSTALDNGTWDFTPLPLSDFPAQQTFPAMLLDTIPYSNGDEGVTQTHRVANTGLMLLKISEKLMHPTPLCFEQKTQIVWDEEKGDYLAQNIPEDWQFCRSLKERGGSLYVTTKVKLYHGLPEYSNQYQEKT